MRVAVVVVGLVAVFAGCTTTTTLTTTTPHKALIIDEHDYGGGDEVDVDIGPGASPVPWQMLGEGDVVVAEGLIERTEPQWGVVAGAVAAAACCVPAAAAGGFCLANPALIAAPLTCLVVGPGAIVAAVQAPSWATVPLTCASTALGASPLLLGLVGQAPPKEVVLEKPPAPPKTSALTPEQSW